jgi:hypothetical protein
MPAEKRSGKIVATYIAPSLHAKLKSRAKKGNITIAEIMRNLLQGFLKPVRKASIKKATLTIMFAAFVLSASAGPRPRVDGSTGNNTHAGWWAVVKSFLFL